MPDSHSLRIERRKGKTVAIDDKAGYYLELDILEALRLSEELATQNRLELVQRETANQASLEQFTERE